jgi:hypothetical protein
LGFYDDVMRGLETAFRRRLGLQQDIGAMQRELHLVEADIATKSASADRVRQALSGHSKSHTQLAGALDDQIRRLDERARLARARPGAVKRDLEPGGCRHVLVSFLFLRPVGAGWP